VFPLAQIFNVLELITALSIPVVTNFSIAPTVGVLASRGLPSWSVVGISIPVYVAIPLPFAILFSEIIATFIAPSKTAVLCLYIGSASSHGFCSVAAKIELFAKSISELLSVASNTV